MSASLVGSEMCIRDRSRCAQRQQRSRALTPRGLCTCGSRLARGRSLCRCLLYTSDAADDM
eukprot:14974623-Alexandrium_andersonii.AAC.1